MQQVPTHHAGGVATIARRTIITCVLAGATLLVIHVAAYRQPSEFLLALQNGDVARVRALIESGEQGIDEAVNKDRGVRRSRITPLMAAAGRGDPSMIACLLELGADPSWRNRAGLSALDAVVLGAQELPRETVGSPREHSGDERRVVDYIDSMALLIDAGAREMNDVERASHVGWVPASTIWRLVNRAPRSCSVRMAQLLVEGAGSGPLIDSGILSNVVARTDVELLEYLMSQVERDQLETVVRGVSLRHLRLLDSVEGRETLEVLLSAGADVDQAADRYGRSLLGLAAYRGDADSVRWLLERGANVNAFDTTQNTPLMQAVLGDAPPRVVQLLLEGGADTKITDANGKTALDLAREQAGGFHQDETVWLLEQHR